MTKRSILRRALFNAGLALSLSATAAFAGQSAASLTDAGMPVSLGS